MLEKNIKYKQIVRLQVYGDDDLFYNSTDKIFYGYKILDRRENVPANGDITSITAIKNNYCFLSILPKDQNGRYKNVRN